MRQAYPPPKKATFSKAMAIWKSVPDFGSDFGPEPDIFSTTVPDNKELQKIMQELMKMQKWQPSGGYAKIEPEEDKEAKEAAKLKRFMTMCFNRTTDFTKCDYCEFRFRCFTEVTKRKKDGTNNNQQREREDTPKKISPSVFKLRPKNPGRRVIKGSK